MVEAFIAFIKKILVQMLSFLPTSPFVSVTNALDKSEYLGYINWLIPFDVCLGIGQAWLTAIAIFYIYQAILRWVKAIE